MQVIKGTRDILGSCNFCSGEREYKTVYELRGNYLLVRICLQCIKIVKVSLK